ncbi:MAG TPA: sugar phosphate isomerase/epimerase family protein [bacterium]|nr:sugar phosphate isomerase/epimerase [Candidatus Omnitrophota bacterium]HOJ62407.1 sugar phosphate isomerase/epimerase family protein [bacterium]HOL93010.1 sugar phosphate isomerase/epimerase family protein [bacterium]HPO99253.1 sugar phosphate isomerase/epimerase family protein [bacterium]HXK93103.1 sugar phosphate isomerase/epimerase family protein [bacterium]
MKFAICNETFQNQTFATACQIAGRCGYEGIELAPFTLGKLVTDLSRQERQTIRQTAADAGLRILGLHWLLVVPPGVQKNLHINCADASIRKQTQDYYKELIRFCADLGGSILVHGSPKQRNWDPADWYQDVFARTVEFFQGCMDTARECGVTVCFEPLTHAETNFMNSARDTRELIRAVGHPNFRLHLDAKAMCGGEYYPPAEVIKQNRDVLKHFHANDRNLRGPGTGDVDFRPIAAALREIGYDGYVSVEVFDYSEGGETIAWNSIEYLKTVFSN